MQAAHSGVRPLITVLDAVLARPLMATSHRARERPSPGSTTKTNRPIAAHGTSTACPSVSALPPVAHVGFMSQVGQSPTRSSNPGPEPVVRPINRTSRTCRCSSRSTRHQGEVSVRVCAQVKALPSTAFAASGVVVWLNTRTPALMDGQMFQARGNILIFLAIFGALKSTEQVPGDGLHPPFMAKPHELPSTLYSTFIEVTYCSFQGAARVWMMRPTAVFTDPKSTFIHDPVKWFAWGVQDRAEFNID